MQNNTKLLTSAKIALPATYSSSDIDRSTKNSESQIGEIETHWPEVDDKDVLSQTEALDGDISLNVQGTYYLNLVA